jgi:hypothetical protein
VTAPRGRVLKETPRVCCSHRSPAGLALSAPHNTCAEPFGHPAQLKQLGRHRSYATLATYIEEGDLFEDNALSGVL